MTATVYAIADGTLIYAVGETVEKCMEDYQRWFDGDLQDSDTLLSNPASGRNLFMRQIDSDFAKEVELNGGDIAFRVVDDTIVAFPGSTKGLRYREQFKFDFNS